MQSPFVSDKRFLLFAIQDIPYRPLALLRRSFRVDLVHACPGEQFPEESAPQSLLEVAFHQKVWIEVAVRLQDGQRLLCLQFPHSLL